MITELPIKIDKNLNPRIPCTLTNPKNNKTIKIDLLWDTGATTSVIDSKYARILGLQKSGELIGVNKGASGGGIGGFYLAPLMLKVGTLKPLATQFLVEGSGNNANLELAIVGNRTMLQFKRVTYTGTGRIRIEDNTPVGPTAKSAFVHVYTDYYYGGIPRYSRKRI